MGNSCLLRASYTEFTMQIHKNAFANSIPIDGVLELTQRCNLACGHCYCVADHTRPEMGFEQICSLLDELSDAGCLWLLLSGGEPLLREDFKDIYLYAKKKGFIISVFTNATLITDDIIDFFKQYAPFVVEVSLYGSTQKTYAKVTGVPNSFRSCMDGISMLVKAGVSLKLKTTLTKDNVHELKQMEKIAADLGVEFRFDAMLHPKLDRNKSSQKVRLSASDVVDLDEEDAQRKKEWEKVWQTLGPSQKQDKLFNCGAGVSSFHIDPYGMLRACDMVRVPAYKLCGPQRMSFQQAWPGLAQLKFERSGALNKCNECRLANICEQCPGWAYLEHGNYESKVDYLCEIAKIRAERMGIEKEKAGGVENEQEKELSKAGDKKGGLNPGGSGFRFL
ncbi:MAG: radical SAM protein [Candidatus Omnitrophota bacterium]